MRIPFLLLSLVFVTRAFAGSGTVYWDEDPAYVPGVTTYKVFLRLEDGTYDYTQPTKVVRDPKGNVSLTGLKVGANYCVVVQASNSQGDSPVSDEACLVIPKLSAPTGFHVW
jgi:hypothetical protein